MNFGILNLLMCDNNKIKFKYFGLLLGCLVFSSHIQAQEIDRMKLCIDSLLNRMTFEEKITQLQLLNGLQIKKENDVLKEMVGIGGLSNILSFQDKVNIQQNMFNYSKHKIPLFFGGSIRELAKTIFPIPLALVCSWDMDAIWDVYNIGAIESAQMGNNFVIGPYANIYKNFKHSNYYQCMGEDPVLASAVIRNVVRGIQGKGYNDKSMMAIMPCLNSENRYSDSIPSHVLSDMYNFDLKPVQAATEVGTSGILCANAKEMTLYKSSYTMLSEIVRKSFYYKGLIIGDFQKDSLANTLSTIFPTQQVGTALSASIDMFFNSDFNAEHIHQAIKKKQVKESTIEAACRHVLEAKYRLGLLEKMPKYPNTTVNTFNALDEKHLNIAEVIAAKSFVLLKNQNNILPLSKSKRVVFIGPEMTRSQELVGPNTVSTDRKIPTLLDELKSYLSVVKYSQGAPIMDIPKAEIKLNQNSSKLTSNLSNQDMIKQACALASKNDVIVCALGEAFSDSSQSNDLGLPSLPECQKTLLHALYKTGKPIILILMNGRPLDLNEESKNCAAILETWNAGERGARAITKTIYGEYNPQGKLCTTFSQYSESLPYYCQKSNASNVLYPFGFGLSYSKFKYSDLLLSTPVLEQGEFSNFVNATATVSNVSDVDGVEIVQLYLQDEEGSNARPQKVLKAFQRIDLKAHETKTVGFSISETMLQFYNEQLEYKAEAGKFNIYIGGNSVDLLKASFVLE